MPSGDSTASTASRSSAARNASRSLESSAPRITDQADKFPRLSLAPDRLRKRDAGEVGREEVPFFERKTRESVSRRNRYHYLLSARVFTIRASSLVLHLQKAEPRLAGARGAIYSRIEKTGLSNALFVIRNAKGAVLAIGALIDIFLRSLWFRVGEACLKCQRDRRLYSFC